MKLTKPMNESTQLNTELLSADARGRKHIPVAVFAVILIHVVLFLVLLIAAGCRSSARAKKMIKPQPEVAQQQQVDPFSAAGEAAPAEMAQQASVQPIVQEQVAVTEPPAPATQPIETVAPTPAPISRSIVQQQQPAKPRVTKAAPKQKVLTPKIYVVKSGDTLGEIAHRHGLTIQAVKTANRIKNDLIHPGQKLQLMPVGSSPLQVRSEQKKGEKEV